MSLNGNLDLLIYINNFFLIEKYGVTKYKIGIKSYYKLNENIKEDYFNLFFNNQEIDKKKRILAQPYIILNNKFNKKINNIEVNSKSEIKNFTYKSLHICPRNSLIKVNIDEIVIFRFDLPYKTNLFNNCIYIDIKLYLWGFKNTSYEKRYKFDNEGFCKVNTITLKINNPYKIDTDYEKIIFEEPYFSFLDILIHPNIYKFKFNPINLKNMNEKIYNETLTKLSCLKDFKDYFRYITNNYKEDLINNFFENTIKKLKINLDNLNLLLINNINEIFKTNDLKKIKYIKEWKKNINSLNFKYPIEFEKYFLKNKENKSEEYLKIINITENKIKNDIKNFDGVFNYEFEKQIKSNCFLISF